MTGLQINAWLDDASGGARGEVSAGVDDWAIGSRGTLRPNAALFADERDDADWRDVGWGVVLADDDELDDDVKAAALDAPEPVRRLLAAREGSRVLRYRPDLGTAHFLLYEADGPRTIATIGGDVGTGRLEMPKYLLIVGSPAQIPWRVQYVLNPTHFVGRLDLDEDGLTRYVDALLSDWQGSHASRRTVLIWSVDLGEDDITWTMRHGLAEPLRRTFDGDGDITLVRHLAGPQATGPALLESLATDHPGLVVSTSHGATPIDRDVADLRAVLGRPVDQGGETLAVPGLDGGVGGAIWYAHACCSAGSDASTLYGDVARTDSDIDRVLSGVTAAGSWTAPLPRQLLGGPSPLRAFVGHVEPTFNWTLRDPTTGQLLTRSLREALYDGLYRRHGEPIGLALHRHFEPIGAYWSRWSGYRERASRGDEDAYRLALEARLAALDRQSVVILGDPVVTVSQD